MDEEEDVLTPYDFIQLLGEDPGISQEFCYLKKVTHPYDLRIVDYELGDESQNRLHRLNRNKSEHRLFNKKPVLSNSDKSECITISSRGIKDESVFVTLEEWQR
jgi:hypothetical protein